MIPKECKRLAEVDFPIAVVSKHAAREKSIRHGHPSTLHLWWARRPLAACRAMLLGLLLPDPCDEKCPKDFKEKARDLLPQLVGKVGRKDEHLRKSLLKFIGDFANWDVSSHPTYLEVGRGLVKAAHGEEAPLVVDPFAGGGSIPLEALRLGCDAFASDLNPVACLILKVMLEDIPRHGPDLAEELRRVGGKIKKEAEKKLAEFYPKDPDGSTPIAYLWARTVKCEAPNCGAEIPLVRSFWLCKKESRKRALRYRVVRPKGKPPRVDFEMFEPNSDREVPGGTVTRARATCLCCGTVLPPDRVRAQLTEQRGGADAAFNREKSRIGGARILAVVKLQPGIPGRRYRLATDRDYEAVWRAQKRLNATIAEWKQGGMDGLRPVPDDLIPREREKGNSGFRVLLYGVKEFGDLFTARQKLLLTSLGKGVEGRGGTCTRDIVGLVVSRLSDYGSAQTTWVASGEFIRGTFGRQALPMVWDFSEPVPWTESSGNFDGALDWVSRVVEAWPRRSRPGQVQLADATKSPLPDQGSAVWFTDPPYYDAVAYADLSDFFLVWLKRALVNCSLFHDPFDGDNRLSPKRREIVQDPYRKQTDGRAKDRNFYESQMASAFEEGRRVLRDDGISCVVFAHKTTQGWEALLSGITRGGWTITASWPIATERPGRLISIDSAALATSVHLVCRPRPEEAPVGDWAEVLRELPRRVGDWMERLQGEGVRGADLVFACIGPALEIFSRYSKVETAEGREVKLAEYLEKVWEVVGRTALEQVLGTAEARARNGVAGALEEDARLTALFLWTLQSTNGDSRPDPLREGEGEEGAEEDEEEVAQNGKAKGYSLIFDVVRRFAQPLGIGLPKWEGRVIETKKGIVRLLSVSERARLLFGENVAGAAADWIAEDPTKPLQLGLFPDSSEDGTPKIRGHSRGGRQVTVDPSAVEPAAMRESTTLDRVHAAMLLQAGGHANALRMLIRAEQDRGPDFLRLANALSALYQRGSEEKRLLDAMLLAVPR
ncbi:MAG: DUF1156 domain-containing protein [bacterium]